METTRSEQLFKKAVDLIPGGVNSPVRAFGNVGMTPRFIASANGVYLTDADGNKYLDYVGSWGPMILGHTREDVLEKVFEACKKGLSFGAATEAEVEMWEHAVQSNPVSERSKAFDPNINFNIYLSREDSHLFR